DAQPERQPGPRAQHRGAHRPPLRSQVLRRPHRRLSGTPQPGIAVTRVSEWCCLMLAGVTSTQPGLPQVGEPAPEFTLPSTEGGDISLADYRDKQAVVLYFYPKDDTPGCTKEACSFRDLRTMFQEHGAEILGVSADTVRSHKKFSQKFGLNFPL